MSYIIWKKMLGKIEKISSCLNYYLLTWGLHERGTTEVGSREGKISFKS